MKINTLSLVLAVTFAGSLAASAHDLAAVDTAAPSWFTEPSATAFVAPAGNGMLMAASFAPFKPKVRYYWDTPTSMRSRMAFQTARGCRI